MPGADIGEMIVAQRSRAARGAGAHARSRATSGLRRVWLPEGLTLRYRWSTMIEQMFLALLRPK